MMMMVTADEYVDDAIKLSAEDENGDGIHGQGMFMLEFALLYFSKYDNNTCVRCVWCVGGHEEFGCL
jgi:hypothetical protein